MEGQEFLTEYRSISNKLKKRFLRRPNVSEASDHFRQLGKRLDDTDEPQYAAFCHLATGRCEQTIGNSPGEIEAVTTAARSFLKAEMEIQSLKNPSFEFHLTAAVSSFSQAAKLQEEAGRPQLAAGLHLELADALWQLKRPTEALPYYQKAAHLLGGHILDLILAKLKIASCYIATPDHHNALLILSEVANFASEHDPCDLYGDIQENVEILRVLLMLIIEPSTHNTSPHLLAVLDRYKGEGENGEDLTPSPYLTKEISLLLQSIVMAIQVTDTEALLFLEDELAPRLTDQQRGLLRVLVNMTVRKV
eukprot:GFUD01004091.1.p1 GENE.GFUD01004091.1~~GFUD01004091.1.p1  ORF type:complete len:307 (+),score=93.35 GFUD01004091.1:468-1388(+)